MDITPQKGFQEDFLSCTADVAIGGGSAGVGKAQRNSSLVLTPNGFVQMGDLQVGDSVMTPYGKSSMISEIHPQGEQPIYKVMFSDATSVEVTGDHLWTFYQYKKWKHFKDQPDNVTARTLDPILETASTLEVLDILKHNTSRDYVCVPIPVPLSFTKEPRKDFPLDPYLFGCLFVSRMILLYNRMAETQYHVANYFANNGFTVVKDTVNVESRGRGFGSAVVYRIIDSFWNTERRRILASHVYKNYIKQGSIPDIYLYASVKDRMRLLQGILDSTSGIDSNAIVFNHKKILENPKSKDDFFFLVRSLGGLIKKTKGYYSIFFGPTVQPYTKKKKLEKYQVRHHRMKHIIGIEHVGFDQATCITIKHPKGLYIAEGFITTHNSWSLLVEGLRFHQVPGFNAGYFRRSRPTLKQPGGLWDESKTLFSKIPGMVNREGESLDWRYMPNGASQKEVSRYEFIALQDEKTLYKRDGMQVALLAFDELQEFTEKQFWYLMTRNRSTCGVKPYVRATCNPLPLSWLYNLIKWWIDPVTGLYMPERSGVIRYFTKFNNKVIWGDSKQEVIDLVPIELKDEDIKSFTFIGGSIYDNKELLDKDPGYISSLRTADEDTKRLKLEGCWLPRLDDRCVYNYNFVNNLSQNEVEQAPNKYLTVDPAREGEDFAVIYYWQGFILKEVYIITKSNLSALSSMIEDVRMYHNIKRADVAIDAIGLGWGVVDMNSYSAFNSISSPITQLDINNKPIREPYENLKTQCAFKMADRVNSGDVLVQVEAIYIDGELKKTINIRGEERRFYEVLIEELLSYMKHPNDKPDRRRLIKKEDQKRNLGRSPDFGDTFNMREFFELNRTSFGKAYVEILKNSNFDD